MMLGTWRNGLLATGLALAALSMAAGQEPISPRLELPFGTDPDRLPGPPRAMGELPAGESQMPSTLPNFLLGPPRAMGFSPGQQSPFVIGPSRSGTGAMPTVTDPSTLITLPRGTLFGPELLKQWSDAAKEGGAEGLPPALRDGTGLEVIDLPSLRGRFGGGRRLTLEEVLVRSEQTYPPFLAVLQQRDVALGEMISTLGPFDVNLNMDTRNYPLGFYNRYVHDVFMEFPVRDLGGKFFSGYRVASGNWPVYYNYLNTLGGGAFVNGFEFPLLKNRAIDPKRAKLYQNEIERLKVEPTVLKQRITLIKDATKAYWGWVTAGQQLAVAQKLLEVVKYRRGAFMDQVEQKLLRSIDIQQFDLIILSRQQQLVLARRRYEQAGIELSLYSRDERGLPAIPDESRLPLEFPTIVAPEIERLGDDMRVALELRPEIFSLRLQIRKAEIDLGLAENQLLPSLTFYVYTEQDVGAFQKSLDKDFRPFIMEASLLFDVPLQRRYAKGQIIARNAEIRQLTMQSQYLGDRIRADVQDTVSALRAAYDQYKFYRESTDLQRSLLQAEIDMIKQGMGTLITFNLREQFLYEALILEIESDYKYFAALADYRAAMGLDVIGFASNPPRTTIPVDAWSTRAPTQPASPPPPSSRMPSPARPGR